MGTIASVGVQYIPATHIAASKKTPGLLVYLSVLTCILTIFGLTVNDRHGLFGELKRCFKQLMKSEVLKNIARIKTLRKRNILDDLKGLNNQRFNLFKFM